MTLQSKLEPSKFPGLVNLVVEGLTSSGIPINSSVYSNNAPSLIKPHTVVTLNETGSGNLTILPRETYSIRFANSEPFDPLLVENRLVAKGFPTRIMDSQKEFEAEISKYYQNGSAVFIFPWSSHGDYIEY